MFQNSFRPNLHRLLIAASATLLIGFSGPSFAGIGQIFSKSGLSSQDTELASNAAKQLYTKSGVKVGDKAKWENTKSGAFGTVEVLKVERTPNCVTFRHLTTASTKRQSKLDSRRCRNSAGEWIINTE